MKFEDYGSGAETFDKLIAAIREVPGVDASVCVLPPASHDGSKIDAEIEFNAGGRKYLLLVEIKDSFVYPRDALQAYWRLSSQMTRMDAPYRKKRTIPLLAAEAISPGAKDFLKSENCGFFDTGGSLFIPAHGVYIHIEKPSPKTFQRSVRSLFRGSRSRVLHALLFRYKTQDNKWFSVKDIAQFAEVSPATASETLSALERFEWLDVRGKGPSKERKLTNPGALLDEWQRQALAAPQRQACRRFYVSEASDGIARRFADICERLNIKYALTAQSAAQIYAPFFASVSRVTFRLASSRYANELYAELEARTVDEGANLEVIEMSPSGELLFRERVGSVWLANPVQVYVDLLRGGGDNKEMAEHLRRERIGF